MPSYLSTAAILETLRRTGANHLTATIPRPAQIEARRARDEFKRTLDDSIIVVRRIRDARARRNWLRGIIRAGAALYDRKRHLRRLVPLTGPQELDPEAIPIEIVLSKLERGLAAERARRHGRGSQWAYDVNREIGLLQALLAERRRAAIAKAEGRTESPTGE